MIVGGEWISDGKFAQSRYVIGTAPGSLSGERIQRHRELGAVARGPLWAVLADLESARRVLTADTAVKDMVAPNTDEFGWETGIAEEYTRHDTGTTVHQGPETPNYNTRGISTKPRPGMVLAIKPVLTAGGIETFTENDGWTVRTCGDSDAARWEHAVAIPSERTSALTASDFGKASLTPFEVVPVEL